MAQSRDTISQRISLDGALEVIRQLRDMGEAGEAAIKQIQNAAEAAAASTSKVATFTETVRAKSELLVKSLAPVNEAFKKTTESVVHMGESLEVMANRIIPHFHEVAEIAFAGSVVGLIALVRETANYANEVHKTSEELDTSYQNYQKLNFALRATGIEEPRVIATFTRLSRSIGAAIEQAKAHVDEFIKSLLGEIPGDQIVLGDPKRIAEAGARTIKQFTQESLPGFADAAQTMKKRLDEVFDINKLADNTKLSIDVIKTYIAKLASDITPEGGKLRTELYKYFDVSLPAKSIGELMDRVKFVPSEMDAVFKRLGVAFQDADGKARDIYTVFTEVGTALDKYRSSGERAYLAQLLFNRGFRDILPLFANGGHEIEKLTKEWGDMGVAMSDVEIKAGVKLYEAFAKITVTMQNLQVKLLSAFSPQIVEVMEAFQRVLRDN